MVNVEENDKQEYVGCNGRLFQVQFLQYQI